MKVGQGTKGGQSWGSMGIDWISWKNRRSYFPLIFKFSPHRFASVKKGKENRYNWRREFPRSFIAVSKDPWYIL